MAWRLGAEKSQALQDSSMTRNASMILTLTDIEILQNELECWGANGAPAWWTWDPEDCGDSSRGQGPKVRLIKLLPSCQVDAVNEIHGVDPMQSDLEVLSISSNRLRNLGSVWSSAGTQLWFKFNVTPTFFKYKLWQGLRMPNTPRGELGSQQARDWDVNSFFWCLSVFACALCEHCLKKVQQLCIRLKGKVHESMRAQRTTQKLLWSTSPGRVSKEKTNTLKLRANFRLGGPQ